MARSAPVLIAVDGRSGAGKSTLALELATMLRAHRPVALFHLEDLYPGWDGLAAGIERYARDVVEPLHAGREARWTAWDWAADTDGEPRTTPAAPVVVLEGVGSGAAAARPLLDAVVWVEVDDGERRRRALERDGETYAPHWGRWAAQEADWLAGDPVPDAADVVVRNAADGTAPGDTLRALLDLPRLQSVLHPEISAAAAPALLSRRVPLPGGADAADLFGRLYPRAAARAVPGEGPPVHAVLLDSSSAASGGFGVSGGSGGRSRFSILADDGGSAGARAEHRNGTTTVARGCAEARFAGPFFAWLDRAWGTARGSVPEGLECGFALGWLGWLGYELKRETGGADVPADALPDAALVHAGRAVVLDHQEGAAWLLALDVPDAGEWLDAAGRGIAAMDGAAVWEPDAPSAPPRFSPLDTRDAYLAKVRAAQEEIREGNSYEVCLTTALTATVADGQLDPWQAYRRLRRRSPAPFAHYVRWGGAVVASTSPERFLRISAAGWMRAEPIKGTRRRGLDPEMDALLRADLADSPKDRAENIMIVDLLRNDLARSADPETLSVPRLCAIESYATVHQMVSTIDARLRPDASRAEAVAAAFPPGSMTGAPKISTMRILDRLEEGRARGVYSGAVGYFSASGAADLSVVIRTLVMHRAGGAGTETGSWHLSLGLGGAVTADSVPEDEWDEVAAKAHGVLSALGAHFPGS